MMPAARFHQGYAVAWAATLALIFAIAVFGRPLQHWVESFGALRETGFAILAVIGIGVAGWGIRHARHIPPARAGLAVVVAAALVAWGLTFDRPEETMHLLLFGLLGALATLAFGWGAAIPVVALSAGADELLQLYLPDRVGDWPDVRKNTLAGLAGCVLGWAHGSARPPDSAGASEIR